MQICLPTPYLFTRIITPQASHYVGKAYFTLSFINFINFKLVIISFKFISSDPDQFSYP